MEKYLTLVFAGVAILLVFGCDDPEKTVANSISNVALKPQADIAMGPCEQAKLTSQNQPVTVYVDALKKLAEQGQPCAQYGLGTLYTMGYQSVLSDSELEKHRIDMAEDEEMSEGSGIVMLMSEE